MQVALQNYETSISIGGKRICNLRFAYDIDLMAGTNDELQELTDRLTQSAGAYGIEISAEQSKTMVNSANVDHAKITMNGEELEDVEIPRFHDD